MITPPDLVTLDYVRQHRRLQSTQTTDNTLLQSMITEASAEFQRQIDRVCMPYLATNVFDYQAPYTLTFRGYDLLAVTTLTNGDGDTISGSEYVLRSANEYPKWRIELKATGTSTFTWDDTWHEAISIAGTWGYVPNYPSFWTASGSVVPAGNISDSATTATLVSAATLEVGMYVRVDSEVLQLVTVNTSTGAITFTRAELGTTAAAHTAAAVIYRANVLPDIMKAVRELAVYAYLSKDKSAGRVTVYEGGTVTVDDLDPSVDRAIKDHRRKQIVSVR